MPFWPKRKAPPSKRELVRVATAPNAGVAGFWQGILAENGIKSLLQGPPAQAAMFALPFNQFQQIFVLGTDAARAKELLEPFIKAEEEPPASEENQDNKS